jgi:hypothetical protein
VRLRPVLYLLSGLLAACGGGSTGPNTQPGVIDKMILRSTAQQFYSPGAAYVFNDNWQAVDGTGQQVPLVDSTGKPIDRGLRYGLGDSLPSESQLVDSTGSVTLPQFIGFLYVFAPTIRAPIERMGQHYIAVQ